MDDTTIKLQDFLNYISPYEWYVAMTTKINGEANSTYCLIGMDNNLEYYNADFKTLEELHIAIAEEIINETDAFLETLKKDCHEGSQKEI